MKTAEIRRRFLDYFAHHGHTIVASSSLVPNNDPTLLFTNAGMVQFKDVFLGQDQRDYRRAVTSQRCVRAGGKHNDLDNVGYTARHHTFFEMLGNFSFGDYFKSDAIRFAWQFLTLELGLPAAKLLVTVYAQDDEAFAIWRDEIGLPLDRIIRIGDNKGERYASDNFWQMGDTGPCGPCTEIFYDHGDHIWGGPPGSAEEDGDRFIEVWNLVFMQFNRHADGTLEPLPAPSVDTGMGLERLAAILQQVHANYEIDLFRALLTAAAEITEHSATDGPSLRVIADHIRSCAFLIVDGITPSNEGRGYVLRRIIRRAVRHGRKLGATEPFFHRLVAPLVQQMGAAYPELVAAENHIVRVLAQEEDQFARTLEHGMHLLEEVIAQLDGTIIDGKTLFTLYDTYGFPVDLTADIARERNLEVDLEGFANAMAQQRTLARQSSQFKINLGQTPALNTQTQFRGYDTLATQGVVTEIIVEGQIVNTLQAGQSGLIVLDETAFYAEGGGQVGDTGQLRHEGVVIDITDCQKQGAAFLHVATVVEGALQVGENVGSWVDGRRRQSTARHHSATHLLHAALRNILGDHVQQKGSLVTPDRLRFDFSHFESIAPEQIQAIEVMVNEHVLANTPVKTALMDFNAARESGAIALFGEKYAAEVRVLTMGFDDFSIELCGGTHVHRTGDIGLFRLVSESAVAAGVRRIEAVVGVAALHDVRQQQAQLSSLSQALRVPAEQLSTKLAAVLERQRELERQVVQLQGKLASQAGTDLVGTAHSVAGYAVIVAQVDVGEVRALRELVDQLKHKLGSGLVLLGANIDGKAQLAAGVTRDLTALISAGDWVSSAAQALGGKGGGKPDIAMAGGKDPAQIPAALAVAETWLKHTLGSD